MTAITDDLAPSCMPYHPGMFGMRRFDLDGAELFFEPATGLTIRHVGPSTAQRRLRAPRLVQFGITNACNLACGFCSRDLEAASAWTADDAFQVLADLAKAGTLEVAFGGGEPLAFRGFDALVERLAGETPLAIGITTNGVLLTEARLRGLEPHVAQLRVSIYDDNDWRRTLALLARNDVPFGVNLLVTREVLRSLEERVHEMVAMGTRDVLLLGYVGADTALLLDQRDEEADLARRVRGLAETLRGRADLKLGVCWGDRLPGVPRLGTTGGAAMQDCGAGRDFVVIGSDRSLAACSFHDTRLPIRSAADVLEAWERHRVALGAASTRPGCARGPGLVQLRTRPRVPLQVPAVDTFHVYAAWASNNSGSYTLVGSFGDRDVARAAGERLATLFLEMRAFYTAREEEVRRLIAAGETRIVLPEVETPAHRLVAAEGLTPLPADFADDDSWPSDGGSPDGNVLITGQQVIVHVGWTVTMPRALSELFFKAGARIDLELVHSHHALVAVATLYPIAHAQSAEEREARRAMLAGLRAEVDALLRSPRPARWPGDEATPPHAWRASDYSLELGLVPRDPVAELAAIRDIAERHEARMHVRFFEALSEAGDPLADMRLRSDGRAAGAWSVVLWREGADRIAVMKVIREHASLGLEETKQRLADLPVAIAEGVTESDATAFAKALCEAGADAAPEPPRRV